jgi:uncharacterized membrane protein (DUF373 family)
MHKVAFVLKIFERGIVLLLMGLMMIAVLAATGHLLVILLQQLFEPPILLLDITRIHEVFGKFLMVVIGLELLEAIKATLEEDSIHAEVVFLVAMVAVARKIIVLDYPDHTLERLLGLSAITIALSVGYYVVKRMRPRPAGQ